MTEAFPLAWPLGWPRATRRPRATFRTSLAGARDGVYRELDLMGVRPSTIVISSNAMVRQDGFLYARQPRIEDPGVAVYFTRRGEELCIPCDKWDRLEDNVRAIGLTINALRGLERWGARETIDAAFRGFAALPAQSTSGGWWTVLGVSHDAPPEQIETAYKAKLRIHHPDAGGSHEQFIAVQAAWQQARDARGLS